MNRSGTKIHSALDNGGEQWYSYAMFRAFITRKRIIPLLLIVQVIPLIAFPARIFKPETQEWWLPVFLSVLTLIAVFQITVRKSLAPWPWYLFSFAQGFNIISRLMMVLPHATMPSEGGYLVADVSYLLFSAASMLYSAFAIWYCELPEVRQRMAPKVSQKSAA